MRREGVLANFILPSSCGPTSMALKFEHGLVRTSQPFRVQTATHLSAGGGLARLCLGLISLTLFELGVKQKKCSAFFELLSFRPSLSFSVFCRRSGRLLNESGKRHHFGDCHWPKPPGRSPTYYCHYSNVAQKQTESLRRFFFKTYSRLFSSEVITEM